VRSSIVASISLGTARTFHLKHKKQRYNLTLLCRSN
jgi:alkylated DNA repair dioxygenase AlkB